MAIGMRSIYGRTFPRPCHVCRDYGDRTRRWTQSANARESPPTLGNNMKPPLAKAVLAGIAFLVTVQFILPSIMQMFLPVSSGACIIPCPANQIKSIQMMPKSKARLYPPFLASSLKPEIVRIHINPYYCPDPTPVLFVRRDGMMEVNIDYVKQPRGNYDTRFSEEAIANVLRSFAAPQSPQQGFIHAKEVYLAISAICSTDIRDKTIPALLDLSHYSVSYIHPYSGTWFSPLAWILAFSCAMSIYQSQKKKTQQCDPPNGYPRHASCESLRS
jgi:hypothetical protein